MDMSNNATSEHFLVQVDRLVDWAPLGPLIDAIGARVQAEVPPATVKMLLLSRWYGMSEAALLEACQDRISFRRFLGLPLSDTSKDARLAEAFRRHATRAPVEAQNLIHAIEAQLLAKGFSIRSGMWAEAAVVRTASAKGEESTSLTESTLFQPGEIVNPMKKGEAAVQPTSLNSEPEYPVLSDTTLFQPGEIADLIKKGEAAMVRGGAMMAVTTNPPYNTGSVTLTPPVGTASVPVHAVIEWPWGDTTQITERLNIGRQVGFSPLASELHSYTHVSRKHAELMVCPEGVWVRDLHSRNGTFVDDERLPPGQGFLVDTDARIRFGPYCAVMFKLKQD
jgi:IS5 family transposase